MLKEDHRLNDNFRINAPMSGRSSIVRHVQRPSTFLRVEEGTMLAECQGDSRQGPSIM